MSPPFRGKNQVSRLKSRLDAAFERIEDIDPGALEARAHYARYLCVLVAGYVEQACKELAQEWCRQKASPTVGRYAASRLDKFQNPNPEKLLQLVGAFDSAWRETIESDFVAELAAVGSVVGDRHLIAHGESTSITYERIRGYYDAIQRLVSHLETRFDV